MDSTAVRLLEEAPSYLDSETNAVIRIETESELTPEVEEFLRDLATTCAVYPSWFAPGGTVTATRSNIELELGTAGIDIRSSDGLPGDSVQYQPFSGGSEDQDRVSSLIDDFTNAVHTGESIDIECVLAKRHLHESVETIHDLAAEPHVWTSRELLTDWLESTNPEHIEDQYVDSEQPHLLFIGNEDIDFTESSWIALAPLSDVNTVCDEYTRPNNPIIEMANYVHNWADDGFNQSQHPLLFNSQLVRDLFSTTFLHTAFRALSDEPPTQHNPQKWTYKISNQDPPLTSVIDYTEYTPQPDQLSATYQLICGFHNVPTKNLQKYWLQAISRSCNSYDEVPNNRTQIETYFDILEEGALQDTLAEATKTADKLYELVDALREDLTDLTQSVTNQVKTIIYGLVAAVITNTFLIIRWANISQTLPFSLFIISVGLLAYFPISAAQLKDTDKNINQSISNFRSTYKKIYDTSRAGLDEYELADNEQELIHATIRTSLQDGACGSQSLLKELQWLCSPTDTHQNPPSTDATHIEQKNAAVTAAQARVTWSIKYLHRLYVILALGWLAVASLSLVAYSPSAPPYIGAALSAIPASALLIRDSHQYSSTVPLARRTATVVLTILLGISSLGIIQAIILLVCR
ncbi:hypothetical protein [Haloferax marisrubri]|uniref:hypothetical protein n=1 Tax=Haloferax marisrubri TaxID=1544719 RepID=UPI000A95B1FB|nr:hypothetical protein [Haloferax marisrubri]